MLDRGKMAAAISDTAGKAGGLVTAVLAISLGALLLAAAALLIAARGRRAG